MEMRNDGAALPNFMRRAFTPHSSLDSEIDLNASYLENAIRVTADLNTKLISIRNLFQY